MSKPSIALIGCGFLGSRHAKCLHQMPTEAKLAFVCDHTPEHADLLAKEYHVPAKYHYEELRGCVDAVIICTPTLSHAQIASYFLNHQTHVFVEKPMTHTLDEADLINTLAQDNNLILQVGHVERFNSAFQALLPSLQDPLFIECHRLNSFSKRSLDIGVVMDLMIHDLDIILGLVQSPIKDVQAVGVNVLTNKEDIANARIQFENGCVANVTASRISPEVNRKIRIFTKENYFSLDFAKQEAFRFYKDLSGIHQQALPIEKEEPLKKELLHFIDCIKNHKKPLVSGIQGRQALDLALTITQKIWDHHNILLS